MKFPAEGTIETYDPSDALGWIRLDDGARVRFGRAACGFDPVAGNRVRVADAAPGPLGHLKAKKVDAVGARPLTKSERIVQMSTLLLMPADSYSSWALACRLRSEGKRADHAAAHAAIREELGIRGAVPSAIDEMVSLARWAEGILSPPNQPVHHAIGSDDDVALAVDTARARGMISATEADRLHARVRALGA